MEKPLKFITPVFINLIHHKGLYTWIKLIDKILILKQ